MPGPYETPGVYIEEVAAGSRPIQGVGTAIGAFLGMTEKCPLGENGQQLVGYPLLVTNWEQYKQSFGGFIEGATLPYAVYGFFQNGGGVCYVESLMTAPATNGKAAAAASEKPKVQLPSRGAGGAPVLELESKSPAPVMVIIADASDPTDEFFKVILQGASGEELYDNVTFKGGKNNVAQQLKTSKLVNVRELESQAALADRRPAIDSYPIPAPLVTAGMAPLTPQNIKDIKGSLAERVGIEGLEAIEEITMVCMPDLMEWQRSGKLSLADAVGLQNALIAHCEKKKDRLAILDSPFGMSVQEVRNWRRGEDKFENKPDGANYDSKFAALYYPWIVIQNPAGRGQLTIPPSGHIAGIYARVDGERGVWKAPANETIRGVTALSLQINNEEQGRLNPHGINCLRGFPGRGIRVWGARTLSSDTEWTYINVRRLFNYIEESIFNGTQWVVFEPNDMDLWERVKRTLSAFLVNLWRDGALFGATPEQAFFVRCDESLNPASVRDAGMLIVEVGLAPVKPAEFVIIRFQQISDGGEVSE